MENSGVILGLPCMPPLPGDHPSERHTIAGAAAKSIIHTELKKLLVKWKNDLDEHGIDALRKEFLTTRQPEDEELKFDFADFNSEIDCDSDSDFSDAD